jgi:Mn2+/Fe2+ NRAMP family transporter
MYTDVFLTMVVYTISTVCFYFLGAAILFKMDRNVAGTKTLEDLGHIYTGSLGNWAATLFVVGGFFVLFSTILSGVAGGTRILTDGLCVLRIIDPHDYPARLRFTRIFAVVSLTLYTLIYALFENPPVMLMISSMMGVAVYPVLGLGTLYLRHRKVDSRIHPTRLTTFW